MIQLSQDVSERQTLQYTNNKFVYRIIVYNKYVMSYYIRFIITKPEGDVIINLSGHEITNIFHDILLCSGVGVFLILVYSFFSSVLPLYGHSSVL